MSDTKGFRKHYTVIERDRVYTLLDMETMQNIRGQEIVEKFTVKTTDTNRPLISSIVALPRRAEMPKNKVQADEKPPTGNWSYRVTIEVDQKDGETMLWWLLRHITALGYEVFSVNPAPLKEPEIIMKMWERHEKETYHLRWEYSAGGGQEASEQEETNLQGHG